MRKAANALQPRMVYLPVQRMEWTRLHSLWAMGMGGEGPELYQPGPHPWKEPTG